VENCSQSGDVAPQMVGVKDFYWEKIAKGWIDKGCPLGQGMCHWKEFHQAIAAANFHGPVTLHLEYAPPV
jgi:sugar phosphate isomerase/epimerase